MDGREVARRAFLLAAAARAARAAEQRRVVAVGDVHGDYDRFFDVLLMAGLVNDARQWTGGRAALVQLGDVVNRGPASRRVLDLFIDLQRQARRAGGTAEMLIGNHEIMRLKGDFQHVFDAEFDEFRTPNSPRKRDEYFERTLKSRPPDSDPRRRDDLRLGYRQQWEARHPLGYAEMAEAFSAKGVYGRWLRRRPVVLLENRTLFVHAGISPKYLMWTAQRFAERMREELDSTGGMIEDEEGPFLYRGLAHGEESELAQHVDALLKRWNADRIVVGHTPQRGPVKVRFGGKVLLADVGLSSTYGGPRACVVIENGEASMLLEGRRVQLK